MCGGTVAADMPATPTTGLSPRVRGNLWSCRRRGRAFRSIPACAGEPVGGSCWTKQVAVYPRVCGGTSWSSKSPAPNGGLSPRVRGNHFWQMAKDNEQRSIPACAGEPHSLLWPAGSSKVYPRVCGGTLTQNIGDLLIVGLSPRVRGNLPMDIVTPAIPRSIPACAGEPDTP